MLLRYSAALSIVHCFFTFQLNHSFEGLSAAARYARQQGCIKSNMEKKLTRLDAASHLARHYTQHRLESLLRSVEAAFVVTGSADALRPG